MHYCWSLANKAEVHSSSHLDCCMYIGKIKTKTTVGGCLILSILIGFLFKESQLLRGFLSKIKVFASLNLHIESMIGID
jgi:hypothetical protein